MLAVMTTTARAALLQRGQQSSPDGSAAGQRQKFCISPGPPVSSILLSRPTTEGDVMGDTHHDPTDHSRTTQPHAGITMKDNFLWPGFILLAVAVFGMISTVAAAAYRHYEWLATTVLVAVLGTVAGALWLVVELRRVTRIEEQ